MFFQNNSYAIVLTLVTIFLSVPASAKFERAELERYPNVKDGLDRKIAPNFLNKIGAAVNKTGVADTARVIVLYTEASALQSSDLSQPKSSGNVKGKGDRLKALKQAANSKLARGEYNIAHEYDQFPMQALHLKTTASLAQLLSDPDVIAIYDDAPLELHLAQSLPFIHIESAINQSITGEGTSVAILDSGVNYTHAAFGNCTSPGVPDTCRVSAAADLAPNDSALDANGHGTNVAAIALGVASATKIIALDVMNGATISTSDVIAGINWVVANRAIYNIAALNMSFGSSNTYSSQCSSFNPFSTPVSNAKSEGISVIASSGNNASSNGIASPACTPGVLAIGAVYDANVGGLNWSVCVDNSSQSDQVGCFSNSAPYLFLLAPGVMITAADATLSGTSQAAPHVAGAMALLKSAYPSLSLTDLELRLHKSDTLVTDPRNNVTTPRLDIHAAVGTITTINNAQIPFLPPWAFVLFIVGLLVVRIKLISLKTLPAKFSLIA